MVSRKTSPAAPTTLAAMLQLAYAIESIGLRDLPSPDWMRKPKGEGWHHRTLGDVHRPRETVQVIIPKGIIRPENRHFLLTLVENNLQEILDQPWPLTFEQEAEIREKKEFFRLSHPRIQAQRYLDARLSNLAKILAYSIRTRRDTLASAAFWLKQQVQHLRDSLDFLPDEETISRWFSGKGRIRQGQECAEIEGVGEFSLQRDSVEEEELSGVLPEMVQFDEEQDQSWWDRQYTTDLDRVKTQREEACQVLKNHPDDEFFKDQALKASRSLNRTLEKILGTNWDTRVLEMTERQRIFDTFVSAIDEVPTVRTSQKKKLDRLADLTRRLGRARREELMRTSPQYARERIQKAERRETFRIGLDARRYGEGVSRAFNTACIILWGIPLGDLEVSDGFSPKEAWALAEYLEDAIQYHTVDDRGFPRKLKIRPVYPRSPSANEDKELLPLFDYDYVDRIVDSTDDIVCPNCEGAGCEICSGTGMWGEDAALNTIRIFERLPQQEDRRMPIRGGRINRLSPLRKKYRTEWSKILWIDGTWMVHKPVWVITK